MFDPLLLPELREMLIEDDRAAMREFCNVIFAAVAAENIEALSDDEVWRILSEAELERRAEIFEFISLPRQVALVDQIANGPLTELLEQMASDDRADLLSAMDQEHVERLMPLMASAERNDIRRLLSYSDDSAGSLMTTDYASLKEGLTAAEALSQLRTQAPDSETIYYIYVIDEGRRLRGFISLRKLILARPDALVDDLMDKDVIALRVDDDADTVVQRMSRYDFIAMPVVDEQNRLVGIVTHDDVLDLVQEQATEELQRLGGVEPLEDSYLATPFFTLAWKRGIWLVALLFAGLGTLQVLRTYDEVERSYGWLVWFLPMVLASGGNAGSQTATLVIRTMALGQIAKANQFRILLREILMGFTLGFTLAMLGFVFALVAGRTNLEAGVVAVTIALVVSLGTVNGTVLPLGLKRMGLDPALMSNPLIASLSDVVGVLTYYNVAVFILSRNR